MARRPLLDVEQAATLLAELDPPQISRPVPTGASARTTVRISLDMAEALDAIAVVEHRTRNAQALHILQAGIDADRAARERAECRRLMAEHDRGRR